MATVVDVISGAATLDIAPFLASLTTLQAQAIAAAEKINAALAGIGSKGVAGLTGVTTAAATMSTGMRSAGTEVTNFGNTLTGAEANLSQLEDRLNSVYRAGRQISALGTTFAMFGGAVTAMMVGAVDAAKQFDFWTAKAEAASGATKDLTTAMVNMPAGEFQAAIEGIANTIGAIKPQEVAQAMYYWASATNQVIDSQQKLKEASAQVQVVLQAATIAGLDSGTAIRGVAQVLGEFGLSVDHTAQVTQTLLNVTQQTDAEFSDMIAAYKMVGPLASSMGIDIAETSAVFGSMADAGLRGTRAGQGFAQMLTSLAKPSKQAQDTLDRLVQANDGIGASWEQAMFPGGKFVGLTDTITNGVLTQQGAIGQLADALKHESAAQAEYDLKSLGSQNDLRTLVPLILAYKDGVTKLADGQIAANDPMTRYQQQLEDQTLQAQLFGKQWDVVSQSIAVMWGSQMNRLQESVMGFGKAAEQALLPFVTQLANVLDGIQNWMGQNSGLTRQILTFVGALASASVVFGGFLIILGKILEAVVAFQAAWKAMGTVIITLGSSIAPLIPVILALVAGLLLLSKWANSSTDLQGLFGNIGTALQNMASAGITAIGDFIALIQALIKGDYAAAWTIALDLVSTFAAGVVGVFQALGKLVEKEIADLVGWLDQTFGGLGTELETWGQNIMTAFANGMTNAISSAIIPAINGVLTIIANFLEGHSPAKEGPLSQVDQWGQSIMEAYVGGMKNATMQPVIDAGTMIKDTLTQAMTDAGKSADWSTFAANFQNLRDQVQGIYTDMVSGAPVAAGAWDTIDAALGKYAQDIQNVIQAQAQVVALQNQISGVKAQIDEKTNELTPYENQISGIQGTIDNNNFKKDDLQAHVTALDLTKRPSQDAIQGIQDLKDLDTARKNDLQTQKDAIQAQIDQEEFAVQPLKEQIQANDDLKQGLQDKISLLDDQKNLIQETINGFARQFQLETEGIRGTIDLLKAKLDVQKAINDQANLPLTQAADTAKNALDAMKEKFALQEEPLKNQIDLMKAEGDTRDSAALQKQLTMMQDMHKAQLDPLQLAYDQASTALNAQKRDQSVAMLPLSNQLASATAQDATLTAQNALDNLPQINALKAQQANIDAQKQVYTDQIQGYNEANLLLNEQVQAQTKMETQQKDAQKLLDLRMAAISRDETNLQLQIDAYNQKIKLIDREEQVYKDQIAAIDRANTALQHQIAGIKLFDEGPINQAIKDLNNTLKGLNLQLTTAQGNLTAAKGQMTLDEQITNVYNTAQGKINAAAKTNPTMPAGPSLSDVNSGRTGYAGSGGTDTSAVAFHLDNPFAKLTKDMQDERDKINKDITGTLDGFSKNFNSLRNRVGGGAGGGTNISVAAASLGPIRDLLYTVLKGEAPGGAGSLGNKLGESVDKLSGVLGGLGGTLGGLFGGAGARSPKAVPALGDLGDTAKGSQALRDLRILFLSVQLDAARFGSFISTELPAAFRNFGDAISGITSKFQPLLDALGRLKDMAGEAIGNLIGKISDLGGAIRTALGTIGDVLRTFSNRLGTVVSVLRDGLLNILTKIGEQLSHLTPVLDAFGAVFSKLGTGVDAVTGPLRDFVSLISRGLGSSETLKSLSDLVKGLGGGAFGKIGDVFKGIFGGVGGVGDVLGPFTKSLATIRTLAAPVVDVITRIFEALRKIPGLGKILDAIPIIGDILMVMQVISALRDAWTKNWMGIQNIVNVAWSKIKPVIDDIGKLLGSNGGLMGNLAGIMGDIGKIASAIFSAIGDLINNISIYIQNNWPAWSSQIGTDFNNIWSGIRDWWNNYGMETLATVGGFFSNLIGGLVNFVLTNALPWALNLLAGVVEMLSNLFKNLDSAVNSQNGSVSGASGGFGAWFQKIMNGLFSYIEANYQTWATNIFNGLVNLMRSLFDLLINIGKFELDFYKWIGGLLLDLIKFIGDNYQDWAAGIFKNFQSLMSNLGTLLLGDSKSENGGMLGQIVSWFGSLVTLFVGWIEKNYKTWAGQIKVLFVNMIEELAKLLTEALLDAVIFTVWFVVMMVKFLASIASALPGWIGQLKDHFVAFIKGASDSLNSDPQPGQNLFTTFKNIITNLLGAIKDFVTKDMLPGLKDIGGSIISGIIAGITAGAGGLMSALGGAVHGSLSGVGGTPAAPSQTGQQLWASQSGQDASKFNSLDQTTQDLFNNQAKKNSGSGGGLGPPGADGFISAANSILSGYAGYCQAFVDQVYQQAYGKPAAVSGAFGNAGTARQAYNNWLSNGAVSGSGTPPPGSLVYFDWTDPANGQDEGHVGVSLGGGQFRSALDNGVISESISQYLKDNQDAGANYLGWVVPYALGTNNAQGGPSLINEKGMELVDMPAGSKVTTASQVPGILNTYINNIVASVEAVTKTMLDTVNGNILVMNANLNRLANQPLTVTNITNVYVDSQYVGNGEGSDAWLTQGRYMSSFNG